MSALRFATSTRPRSSSAGLWASRKSPGTMRTRPYSSPMGVVTLTIWRVTDPGNAVPFNRKTNIGLHHLALAVADEAALATVYQRVSKHPGVMLEFAPEPVRPGSTTHHFICAIPGGLRIEFATRPS